MPSQQFVQAWTNRMRTLSTYTPAQLLQIARNNQVAYQQLLRQQYLFQQAMLRNPQALLQVQSLWMAQLHQHAMLHKQQQQALAAASVGAGLATTSSDTGVSTSGVSLSSPQTSKLLGTMSNSGSISTSESATVSSVAGSGFHSSSKTKGLQSDSGMNSGSKPPHQTVSSGSKGPSVPASSTGYVAGAGRGFGSARSSTQLTNGPVGQQNSNSKSVDTRQYSKPPRNLTKSKVGGTYATSSHNASATSDKKSRQKSSK